MKRWTSPFLNKAILAGLLIIMTLISTISLIANAESPVLSESEQAQQFAKTFYNWYAKVGDEDHAMATIDYALQQRPDAFSKQLYFLLKRDFIASSKVSGEIVGLDFDPILNSQEAPAPSYQLDNAALKEKAYWVTVWATNGKEKATSPTCQLIITQENKHWVIQNVYYPDVPSPADQDLISILNLLEKDRQKSVKTPNQKN